MTTGVRTGFNICRTSHMGAQLNPTSIALVVSVDYPSAIKMDVAGNGARTRVLPSVAYHWGGDTGHKTRSRLKGTPSKIQVGGVLFTCTLHLAIGLTTAHSGVPLAPKTVALAVLAGACCGVTK